MKSKHFKIQELVPEHIYKARGEKSWELLDEKLLKTIDTLKEQFPKGSMTINNWLWGGNRNWSGLRTPDSPDYSETSQHTFGRAADMKFSAYDEADVRKFIINNPEMFPYVKGIEDFKGMTWVHIDVRNTLNDTVSLFNG